MQCCQPTKAAYMEHLPHLVTLAGIILLACASPGPDFVAVTSFSLKDRRAGMLVGIGIACAVAMWATLAILGFGLLIREMFWLYEIIRLAGAVYLTYLGARMLIAAIKSTPADMQQSAVAATTSGGAFRRGLLVGLTNPKTATFFATLFVTLLPAAAPAWVYFAVVAIVFVVTCTWLCLLAAFFSVGRVQTVYTRIRKPVDALMGAALLGLGIRMATHRS